MRKVMISLLVLLIASTISVGAAPDYAKWGALAVKETQKRYQATILDYKHLGRTDLTSQKSEEIQTMACKQRGQGVWCLRQY